MVQDEAGEISGNYCISLIVCVQKKKIVHETFLPHLTVDLAASGPQNIEYYGSSDGKESA